MVIRRIAILLALVATMGALSFALLLWHAETALDQPSRGDRLSPALLLETADGAVFAARGGAGGKVDLASLPKTLIDAVVSIEDRRFFSHPGIDPRGLLRAASADVAAGAVREGGSTITQQLVKLDYLTSERTFARKIQEAFLALALERRFSKQEILARYLARIYLGAGAYGVDAASLRYFGKPAHDLDLAESAMIAGLIRAPTANAPTTDLPAAQARADQVLQAMVETGSIDQNQARDARAHPAILATGGGTTGIGVNYFADWVAADLPQSAAQNGILHTTLDAKLQALAESSVARILAQHGKQERASEAAMVVMTPSGAVKAMVGGRSFAESQFNRAVTARRQPGSSFKPFVYLAALEAGVVTPYSLVTDAPVSIDGWSPGNFSGRYLGTIPLQTAFAESINTVAVQLAARVGAQRVVDTARRLGIRSPLTANPSIALGTSEVSLLEMTSAYAVFANHGRMVRPYGAFTSASESDAPAPPTQGAAPGDMVIAPDRTDDMLRLMSAVVENGSGKAARFDRPAAGKTGTSQDFRDAWFIGFTADLVVGVWVGNDDDSPTRRVVGGGMPAQIWHDFMKAAYATGRFGNTPRMLVAPAPPPPPMVASLPSEVPDMPGGQPSGSFVDHIGRGLGSIADGFLSIFQ